MADLLVTDAGQLVVGPGGQLVLGPGDPVALPTIAIGATSTPSQATEGSDAEVVFTITLSGEAPADVTVAFATQDGSALAGLDYTAVSQSVTITQGQTSKDVSVPILDDDAYRPQRSFTASISNAFCAGAPLVITTATGSASILDDETPSAEASPLADGVHPRLFIVPDNYTVEGAHRLSDFRQTICQHYATEFQATITNVNGRYSTNVSTQDIEALCWDAFVFAMLALADPAQLDVIRVSQGASPFNWGGRTQLDYVAAVKARVEAYRTRNLLSSATSDGSPDVCPQSLLIACAYDWTMAIDADNWSESERQNLVNAMLYAYNRRSVVTSEIYLSEQTTKGLFRATPIGLAMAHDTIAGTASTGASYEAEALRMANQYYDDWSMIADRAEFYYSGRGYFHGGHVYAVQALPAWNYAFAALSTAYNDNFFARYGFLRTMPQYWVHLLMPVTLTGTKPRAIGVVHKTSSMYEMAWGMGGMHPYAHFLEAQYPEIGRVMTYYRQNVTAGVSTSSSRFTQNYPFSLYLWGHRQMPAVAPSSVPASWPLAIRHGMGDYCLRTSNEPDNDATVLWFWAMDRYVGGHMEPKEGMIELHRHGQLIVNGGTHKNWGGDNGISNNHGQPEVEASTCRIGSINETPGGTMQVRYAGRAVTADSGLDPYCTLYSIGCWATKDVADLNKTLYHYVRYDRSAAWATGRAPFHVTEVTFLRPVNGGQPYVLVVDRVTRADASTNYIVQNWKVPFRPVILDGATQTLVDGPGTGDPNNADSEGASGEWESTTRAWSMTNNVDGADGRLFARHLFAPASEIVRIFGGDYNWSCRDLTWWPGSGGRLDTNRCDGVDVGSNADKTGTQGTDAARTYMRNYIARWSGRWSVQRIIPHDTAGTEFQLLTLFFPGRASQHAAMPTVSEITSQSGGHRGAYIADAGRPRLVLTPTNHAGTPPGGTVVYALPALGVSTVAAHVVQGLSPNTAHSVVRSTVAGVPTFTITPGSGSVMSSANGVLEVTV